MESLIGIISGLIGIISALITISLFIYRHFKTIPLKKLMITLVDNSLSQKKHQCILRKMNKILLVSGNSIKDDYIKNFYLNGRGKETVFMDICESNNIEPTAELCKRFLDTDLPTFRKKYHSERTQSVKSPMQESSTDKKQQVIYVSELLQSKFPACYNNLVTILEKYGIEHRFIKGTKDIWCRDYMPVQTESGKLIQFQYNPSYLKGDTKWEASRSDVREICEKNHLKVLFSDINLDGGNVLICSGRAIISDRVMSENPSLTQEDLLNKLSNLLECEIIIIPAQKSDFTGHADGMVRFVDKNTILGNDLASEYQYWSKDMKKIIDKYGLRYIDMPFFEAKDPKHKDSAVGIYVNYLELDNLIIVPVFKEEQDNQAVDVLKSAFPDKKIETIDYTEVAQEGGLLNCTTWVVWE